MSEWTQHSNNAKDAKDAKEAEDRESRLYEQVGKLQVELAWMKKKARQLGIDV